VSKSPQSVSINGVITENQQLIADSFQNHFLSTRDKIVSNINNTDDAEENSCIDYLFRAFNNPFPNIIFNHTMISETKKIINSLKTKSSCGYDESLVKILKVSSPFTVLPLKYICNRSIMSGSVPSLLKYSVIKPLFKKGEKNYLKNYRHISLIFIRLSKHVINSAILSLNQYGFRSSFSTEKAIFKLLNDILQASNNKAYVGSIFCNHEKAFDCTNHETEILWNCR
jgi:hypothetical protein